MNAVAATPGSVTGAVDIGGTKITVGLVDDAGRVLRRADMPTAAPDGFDPAMQRIAAVLERFRAELGCELCGVGIGCTGPVDPFSGEVCQADFLPGWQGCNLVAALQRCCGVRVVLENDAVAAALGELFWGAGRGWRNFICVTVGTGIGGGIIVNGALYRGVGGAHPEVGHHTIDASGPLCYCGARGCWEVLASGTAIAAQARFALPAADPQRDTLTADELCARARSGDAAALRAVARGGRYLGIGVANLVTMYAPDAILLSGSVMDSVELFLPTIRAVVRECCTQVPADQVTLATPSLGKEAPLVGAAAAWWHRHRGATPSC